MSAIKAPWLEEVSADVVGRITDVDADSSCLVDWIGVRLEVGSLVTIRSDDSEGPISYWVGLVLGDRLRILNSNVGSFPGPGCLVLKKFRWKEHIDLSHNKTIIVGRIGVGKNFVAKLLLQSHLDLTHHKKKKEKLLIFDSRGEYILPWSEEYVHHGFIQRSFVNRLAMFTNADLVEDLNLRKLSSMKFDLRELSPTEAVRAFCDEELDDSDWHELKLIGRPDWNQWCEGRSVPVISEKMIAVLSKILKEFHQDHCPLKLNLLSALIDPALDVIVLDVKALTPKQRQRFTQFVISLIDEHNNFQHSLPLKIEDELELELSLLPVSFSEAEELEVYRDMINCLIVQDSVEDLSTKLPELIFQEVHKGSEKCTLTLHEEHRCIYKSEMYVQELPFSSFEHVQGKTLLEILPLKNAQILSQMRAELESLKLLSEDEVLKFLNTPQLCQAQDKLQVLLRFCNSSVISSKFLEEKLIHALNLYLLAEIEKLSQK